MKIIQKLFSHGLLIGFFVASFFTWQYRADLFPQWFGSASTPRSVMAASAPAAEQASPQPLAAVPVDSPPAPVIALESPPEVPAQPTAPSAQYRPLDVENVEPPPLPAPVAPEPAPEQPEPSVQPQAEAAASAPVVAQDAPQVQPSAPETSEQVEPEQVEEKQTPSESQTVSDDDQYQQQLNMARSWFWRRDLRNALLAYEGLVESWPARASAWGELGNLYMQTGNRGAAAEAYDRTINLLLDQHQEALAYPLLDVLYRLDAGRASELEQRFSQVRN